MYQKNSDCLIKEVNGSMVILNMKTGDYYGLNDVGADFMKRVELEMTWDEIFMALCTLYDVEADVLEQDLHALVRQLMDRKILIEMGDHAG